MLKVQMRSCRHFELLLPPFQFLYGFDFDTEFEKVNKTFETCGLKLKNVECTKMEGTFLLKRIKKGSTTNKLKRKE